MRIGYNEMRSISVVVRDVHMPVLGQTTQQPCNNRQTATGYTACFDDRCNMTMRLFHFCTFKITSPVPLDFFILTFNSLSCVRTIYEISIHQVLSSIYRVHDVGGPCGTGIRLCKFLPFDTLWGAAKFF